MRPLDVLVVLPSLERGGAERVAVNLMDRLAGHGDRVRVVLMDGRQGGGLRGDLGPTVPVTALAQSRARDALLPLVRLVRRDPPDVVLSTHTHVNLWLCAARPLLPRRTRLVLREPTHAPVVLDGRPTRSRRLAQRALYRRADLVLATSSVMRDDLRRLVGDRVALVANPVEVAAIRDVVAADPVTRPATGRRFVSVGRLDSQKSLPDLIAAFAEGSDPDDELVLIGDGPERDTVIGTAVRLGVGGRVRLTGRLAKPWAEVAASDAFLLASRAEGMPNAVLESLAVGTPVVATDDLDVLEDVRASAAEGAIVLVPREGLAAAVRAVRPASGATRDPSRASLLPERFDATVATLDIRRLLEAVVSARDGT